MANNYEQLYKKYKLKYLALKQQKAQSGGGERVNVILFKAEWCGWCKKFQPTWEKLEKFYSSKYNFTTYDADKNTKEVEKYEVDGFPSIKFEYKGKVVPYEGDRSESHLIQVLESFNQ
jgi:thiol-disulfide isomerase/thioredoxin